MYSVSCHMLLSIVAAITLFLSNTLSHFPRSFFYWFSILWLDFNGFIWYTWVLWAMHETHSAIRCHTDASMTPQVTRMPVDDIYEEYLTEPCSWVWVHMFFHASIKHQENHCVPIWWKMNIIGPHFAAANLVHFRVWAKADRTCLPAEN